jgi:hypothetical protein
LPDLSSSFEFFFTGVFAIFVYLLFRFALVGDAYSKCTRRANLPVNFPMDKPNKLNLLRDLAVLVPHAHVERRVLNF